MNYNIAVKINGKQTFAETDVSAERAAELMNELCPEASPKALWLADRLGSYSVTERQVWSKRTVTLTPAVTA